MLEKIVKSVEELNAVAMHLLQVKDLDALRVLAKTWSIPYQQTEDYIQGKRYRLAQIPVADKAYKTASEKLREEMLILNDKYFADIVAWHLISKCEEDDIFSGQVLKKHKSLQRCLDYVSGRAFEVAQEQARQKGFDRVPQNTGLALTEKEVFPWAEEYYKKQDEDETAKKEAEEKQKIISDWDKKEQKSSTVPAKTAASGKGKKPSKKTMETDRPEKKAAKDHDKKDTPQQMSLFDLQ